MCAQHGQQLYGKSSLWECYWQPLANDKDIHCDIESEGSQRQKLGLRDTNYIQGYKLKSNGEVQ